MWRWWGACAEVSPSPRAAQPGRSTDTDAELAAAAGGVTLAAVSLLTELDAFYVEHRRCGELEARHLNLDAVLLSLGLKVYFSPSPRLSSRWLCQTAIPSDPAHHADGGSWACPRGAGVVTGELVDRQDAVSGRRSASQTQKHPAWRRRTFLPPGRETPSITNSCSVTMVPQPSHVSPLPGPPQTFVKLSSGNSPSASLLKIRRRRASGPMDCRFCQFAPGRLLDLSRTAWPVKVNQLLALANLNLRRALPAEGAHHFG